MPEDNFCSPDSFCDARMAINESAEGQLNDQAERDDLSAKLEFAVRSSKSDPTTAVRLFRELDASDVDGAAFQLGSIYWLRNVEEAKMWFARAQAREDFASPAAALARGILLLDEVPSKVEEAKECLIWAKARGELRASYWLGIAHEKCNPAVAIKFFQEAASQGESQAYHRMARLMRRMGDKKLARDMFRIGADEGDLLSIMGLFQLDKFRHPSAAIRHLARYWSAGGFRKSFLATYRREQRRHNRF